MAAASAKGVKDSAYVVRWKYNPGVTPKRLDIVLDFGVTTLTYFTIQESVSKDSMRIGNNLVEEPYPSSFEAAKTTGTLARQ